MTGPTGYKPIVGLIKLDMQCEVCNKSGILRVVINFGRFYGTKRLAGKMNKVQLGFSPGW